MNTKEQNKKSQKKKHYISKMKIYKYIRPFEFPFSERIPQVYYTCKYLGKKSIYQANHTGLKTPNALRGWLVTSAMLHSNNGKEYAIMVKTE